MRLRAKAKLIIKYIFRVARETLAELHEYYWSPYPILLILGAFKRIKRRYKTLFVPKGRGRPPIQEEIVELIIEMKMANKIWGALRISQELALLGMSVHKKTVQNILREYGLVPPRNYTGIKWRSFLKSFKYSWAMDFTTVFDSKGLQLFILNVIDQHTRELIITNCTYRPNRNWIIQQFKNLAIDDRPMPTKLIVDNDGIFGKWIGPIFKDFFEIKVQKIPPQSPNFNPYIERYHRSLKDEVLRRSLIIDDDQVRDLIIRYGEYYNNQRPHQGLGGKVPTLKIKKMYDPILTVKTKFRRKELLDGLITSFEVAA